MVTMENKLEILDRLVKEGHIDLKEALILLEVDTEPKLIIRNGFMRNDPNQIITPLVTKDPNAPPYTITCTK